MDRHMKDLMEVKSEILNNLVPLQERSYKNVSLNIQDWAISKKIEAL